MPYMSIYAYIYVLQISNWYAPDSVSLANYVYVHTNVWHNCSMGTRLRELMTIW